MKRLIHVVARLANLLSASLAIILFFAAWSVGAILLRPAEGLQPMLPGPITVLRTLIEMIVREQFLTDIYESVFRIVAGLLASIIPAFFLGVLFGVSPRIYSAASPLFAFAKYVPPVSLIPIFIIWFGVGLPQQMAVLFAGTFFYLTVMIAETVAGTPSTYRDAALTLGAKNWQLIWKVRIMHGLPEFIQHLRTMVGIAWTYLVAVEMVAAPGGIGRVTYDSAQYQYTDRVLAGIFTIGLMGILFDELLQWTRWFLCPWKRDDPPWFLQFIFWLTRSLTPKTA